MASFINILHSERLLCFDGGMGTMLQARGLPAGLSPEVFCLERPDVLRSIHEEYLLAGADIITTNTFGGTQFKLPAGLEAESFNREMASSARAAIVAARDGGVGERPLFVAGSMGPTGHFLRPLGPLTFTELVEAFRAQARGLVQGGVDLILAETHFDLGELRALVVAVREECDLPLGVSMTFDGERTLTGTSPEVFRETMLNMGVDFIATNCSSGPEQMRAIARRLAAGCPVPVLAEPNAGLPELENGKTVFRLDPETFAEITATFAADGVRLLGGCCGTTPAHIAALRKAMRALPPPAPLPQVRPGIVLTSRAEMVHLGAESPIRFIGERINPTGKKQLTAELQAGEFSLALSFAEEQIAAGARLLDVNVGAPMVDETAMLPDLVGRIIARHPVPLALDSSNMDAVAAGLMAYPASCLINSISGEKGRMERLGPLCRKFGAPFILLPLRGGDLPVTAAQRIRIIDELLAEAEGLGIPRRLIIVDVLALAASSVSGATRAALETIGYCAKELKLPTTIGLSNISFGLPARELLNSSFLAMAAGAGLSSCIAHPGNERMRDTLAAVNALLEYDPQAEYFSAQYAKWTPGTAGGGASGTIPPAPGEGAPHAAGATGASDAAPTRDSLAEAVIKGRKEEILALVDAALAAGAEPFNLVNERLIPAITEVGRKYECKEYFLPQLLRSAETMQTAFSRLKPLLEEARGGERRPVVVMATVEGDIHDIGKNIVSLMLGNHGFEVVDIGKDRTAGDIVAAAEEHGAVIIGLSALMTTTMVRMEDTVKLVKERDLPAKVIVGGAVVNAAFAEAIGADGYSGDAVDCVRLVRELLALPGN